MDLLHIAPELLRANPFNTNIVNAENMQKLARSLERNGWVKPVLVRQLDDGVLEILGGQHRVEAAITLGQTSVPVLNLGKIEDRKAKEIGLIDNTRYGADDAMGLAELIEEIGGIAEIGDFLPFSETELAALATQVTDEDIENLLNNGAEADDAPAPKQRPVKSHQMMRMKVPVDDAETVSETLTAIMKDQGFTEEDTLTNAGDALVFLVKCFREGSTE